MDGLAQNWEQLLNQKIGRLVEIKKLQSWTPESKTYMGGRKCYKGQRDYDYEKKEDGIGSQDIRNAKTRLFSEFKEGELLQYLLKGAEINFSGIHHRCRETILFIPSKIKDLLENKFNAETIFQFSEHIILASSEDIHKILSDKDLIILTLKYGRFSDNFISIFNNRDNLFEESQKRNQDFHLGNAENNVFISTFSNLFEKLEPDTKSVLENCFKAWGALKQGNLEALEGIITNNDNYKNIIVQYLNAMTANSMYYHSYKDNFLRFISSPEDILKILSQSKYLDLNHLKLAMLSNKDNSFDSLLNLDIGNNFLSPNDSRGKLFFNILKAKGISNVDEYISYTEEAKKSITSKYFQTLEQSSREEIGKVLEVFQGYESTWQQTMSTSETMGEDRKISGEDDSDFVAYKNELESSNQLEGQLKISMSKGCVDSISSVSTSVQSGLPLAIEYPPVQSIPPLMTEPTKVEESGSRFSIPSAPNLGFSEAYTLTKIFVNPSLSCIRETGGENITFVECYQGHLLRPETMLKAVPYATAKITAVFLPGSSQIINIVSASFIGQAINNVLIQSESFAGNVVKAFISVLSSIGFNFAANSMSFVGGNKFKPVTDFVNDNPKISGFVAAVLVDQISELSYDAYNFINEKLYGMSGLIIEDSTSEL